MKIARVDIDSRITALRGQKVILDADLAELYGVETRVFNQAVKRNAKRFRADFCFRLTASEWKILKSQIVTSSLTASQKAGAASKLTAKEARQTLHLLREP